MNSFVKLALALGLALSPQPVLRAQVHGHLNAGAFGTNQNDQLYFVNAPDFIESSGYVKTLIYTNASTYAGYYQGNISLTAIAAMTDPAAPALGSYIQASIVSVEGPAGGAFAFWENGASHPTYSLLSGLRATNLWRLTESDGSPGSDSYGHIHGRKFTATNPGIYKVGFKLFDTSTNGAGGGPIHTPSEALLIYFQAGINIAEVAKTGSVTTVKFGSVAGLDFNLEYTTTLSQSNSWIALPDSVPGNDFWNWLTDTNATDELQFYRVKATPP